MDKIEQLLLSECIYKVLMASGVVTSSDACDLSGAIETAVLEAQTKQEPWPFSADRVTYHKAAPVVQPQQEPVGKPHRWNDDGERCLDCGDKDWMADKYCSAAPVVQPDMVMVPREPTEAMLDAAMNRYQHVSPEAKARYTQMHRENFRCDYKEMIAAAEGKP